MREEGKETSIGGLTHTRHAQISYERNVVALLTWIAHKWMLLVVDWKQFVFVCVSLRLISNLSFICWDFVNETFDRLERSDVIISTKRG